MLKIVVDMTRCQHYGQCVLEAPAYFSLNADDRLEYVEDAADEDRELLENAVDICPMQAIRIDEQA